MKWRALHQAFDSARRVGHSWAAARGALQSGGVVICWTMEQARRLTEETNAEAISLNFIDSLRGRPRPMVVDNHVASMMAAEIMRLEARLERDQGVIFELGQDKVRLRSEVFYLESALHMLGTIIEEARLEGAFRVLADIGLAVAYGEMANALHALDCADDDRTIGSIKVYGPPGDPRCRGYLSYVAERLLGCLP
jgi:hypothetical protein